MSQGYISADYAFWRTAQLMGDASIDLLRVKVPYIKLYHDCGEPMALFGPIERPNFVIDESLLPY